MTDPVVGYLSGRTRSRWGRRCPCFLFGSVPLGLAFVFMFRHPGFESQTALIIWSLLAYMILFTAYTIVNIPYVAIMPELTKDFHERTNLTAYRSIFSVSGTLIGAGAALPIILIFDDKSTGFLVMAAVFGAVITISAVIPFFATKESPTDGPRDKSGIYASYREALKNKPYLFVLFPWSLNTAGITIVTSGLNYYFKYIFNQEKMLSFALVILLVKSMIFMPVSVKAAKRFGEKNSYVYGMLLVAVSLLVMFFMGHMWRDNILFAALFVFLGAYMVYPIGITVYNGFYFQDIFTGLGLAAVLFLVLHHVWKYVGKEWKAAGAIYMATMLFMVHRAVSTFFGDVFSLNQSLLLTAGTSMLFIADTEYSIHRFIKPFKTIYGPLLYPTGQLLIALSASFFPMN